MTRITKEELPDILTDEVIEILADMAMESPQSAEWSDIYDYLIDNNYPSLRKVLDEVQHRHKEIEQAKEDAKSVEQKTRERKEWDEFVENADPKGFYGNMGQPETLQEYKNRYGAWPPGYDKDGNRLAND